MGVTVTHRLGGSSVDLNGTRALAQTRVTILQRAPVEGMPYDVTCIGRFYDSWSGGTADGDWCCTSRSTSWTG